MYEKVITSKFSMFEAATPSLYQSANDCFVNCSLIVPRQKTRDNCVIYLVEGLESDVRNFLEVVIK
jgi:hypothetical protein